MDRKYCEVCIMKFCPLGIDSCEYCIEFQDGECKVPEDFEYDFEAERK